MPYLYIERGSGESTSHRCPPKGTDRTCRRQGVRERGSLKRGCRESERVFPKPERESAGAERTNIGCDRDGLGCDRASGKLTAAAAGGIGGPEMRARAPAGRARCRAKGFAHRKSNRGATRHDRGLRGRVCTGIAPNRDNRGPDHLASGGCATASGRGATSPARPRRQLGRAPRHLVDARRHSARSQRPRARSQRFFLGATSGTPDAFSSHATGTRRVRVGSLVLSSSSRVPRCPAILRPMQKEEV